LKSDPDQPIYRNSAQLPGFREFLSPEVSQNGVDVLKGPQTVKFDSWKLGTLIYRLFNDGVSPSSNEDLNRANNIPKVLVPAYKKLLSSSLTVRATPEAFLKNGENSFFGTKLIYFARDLEEFSFKTEDEKLQIFQTVESIKDELPVGLLENKLLPDLIAFQSQYPAHVSQIIRLILSLCGSVSNETHIKLINPIIIKAFTLPDRAIRVLLLGTLPKYIDLLTKSQVSDNIFNNFVTGFSDSNPAIREETIKATLFIVPKLSDRQLNNDLLRFLAKTQSDEKPQIRTNTTILIGKIAQHLNKSSRSNVLATAFGKALKDPFIHSRIAAILALSSSIEYFTPDVISNKILTVIAPSLLDKSSKVREEAQKSFDLFFQKIKEEAAKLPIDSYDDGEVGSDQVVKEVTENVANFGMISGTFNKLTSGLSGSLNQENSITPESSRTGTPGVIASFDRYQQNGADSANAATSHQVSKPTGEYNSWGNDDFDVEEEDDGWGMGDLEVDDSKITSKIIKPATFVAPKVTGLATETTKKPLSSRTSSFGTSAAPKKKGLQLKPKSKLKLDLDAGDDNGWDDGW
jgi:SCY1-like protein 1